LRHWKTMKEHEIPLELEIGYIPPSSAGQYPGLYLFSTPARMMRPVKFLPNGKIDMIGSFEQVYMNIACQNDTIIPGLTTHQEISPHNMLSILANLTPFSDHNQSPRNMYQCQMAKQTMGTPSSVYVHRTDNKLYRLQTGQAPVVRPKLHDELGLDAWLNGTNAIVAVLSYTGYDMEDAMIINQQSHQRGFAYGNIYKSVVVDLNESRKRTEALSKRFMLGSDVPDSVRKFLDKDGLPFIGTRLEEGNPFYAYYNETTGSTTIKKYKDTEIAYVDEVRLIGDDRGEYDPQKIHIKLRVPRPPVIGDKFSSRHGQKGVLSQLWPQWDMPFTESGMQPDIIINPHAFPSRMTIGMFIESLAGKAGALHGIAQDCAPFKFAENTSAMNDSDENPPAMDYFGEQLRRAGFNYHGNEPMYSGITGEEFRADIYIGVVYYQRLRHMVSDKWQVRATGPVHNLTMQPVKGRKRAGGIRFGEMERDALLAHGVSYCLQDRLLNCSDYAKCLICKKCGSIFSVLVRRGMLTQTERKMDCRTCKSSQHLSLIKIPYAFKYLATELMSMGVKIKIETSP
ncbi:7386_t:CDS:2, partial [Paraglomus occultum]